MSPIEQAAKAAYEKMRGLFWKRHPVPAEVAGQDSLMMGLWEQESEALREDWIAVIGAAIAEEREACARLAELATDLAVEEGADETTGFVGSSIVRGIRARGEL